MADRPPVDRDAVQTYEIHAGTARARPTAVGESTLAVAEIGPWLARTYGAVAALLAARGGRPAGPPFARYHRIDDDCFRVEAGFPVATAIDGSDGIRPSTLPGGPIAMAVHIGPYDRMAPAYTALTDWVRARGGELAGDAWEVYFSDPAAQPDPATWRTEIVQPYRLG